MDSSIAWFENICSVAEQNPALATKELSNFQETENAHRVAIACLSMPDVFMK